MVDEIRATLAATPARTVAAAARPRAAVLVGIVAGARPRLLLIKRSDTVPYHRGEIAFPGGRMEEADRDPWRCALREAEEEVGLPPAAVSPLGQLDDLVTSSGFVVTPFVAVIDTLPRLTLCEREVARTLTPLAAPLLVRGAWSSHLVWDGSGVRPIYSLAGGRPPIWGATAAILVDLAHRLDPPPAGGDGVAEAVAPYGAPHRPLSERAPDLVERLLAWYRPRARDLPWRRTRDPYRVWLSEIMLQQTRVETVLPYYERFLARFPTVEGLAAASEDEVLRLWEGLGYYRRARHLHAAAKEMAAAGVPVDATGWARLPGVGRSTAGAIAAICFGERAPVLDGNVKRALARLLALRVAPATPIGGRILWSCAHHLTPAADAATYTQAIMELGATCCTPRSPACGGCPWRDGCGARALDLVGEIPVAVRRGALPHHREIALVVRHGGRLLLQRRADGGLLAGLWAFPHTRAGTGEGEAEAARRLAAEVIGRTPTLAPLTRLEHAYTHFRITLHAFAGEIDAPPPAVEGEWVEIGALGERPMAVTDRTVARVVVEVAG